MLRTTARLRDEVQALSRPETSPLLEALERDPANTMLLAGYSPDPWQARVLRARAQRLLMLAGRQTGKSRVAAALALWCALVEAPALVLILARAERQAGETFRKLVELYWALGGPVAKCNDMTSELHLVNGSRVIPLPGKEETVRSFSAVRLLVIDEAARVPDALHDAVSPMLAVGEGRLVCVSSAYARCGFFFKQWTGGGADWERVTVRSDQCPRIRPEFLASERRKFGLRVYEREYENVFSELEEAVFRAEDLDRAFGCEDVLPWR
jgi:hypothetical protein